ncbi:hypothetical protein M0R04_07480 [Candidatus Dojkabacteria bacterium]|jgi:hypothetical protein|nr:hypothetical protein [Candidatus Dojkabacteria bacterium]
MNRQQFDKLVYPTIGKIKDAQHLQDVIKSIMWQRIVVEAPELGRGLVKPATIDRDVFYCYVTESVYIDWRANNTRMENHHVIFTPQLPGIYRVTLDNHYN